jgi:hypothetical protein
MTFRWLAEVHRQRPLEDNERLLLKRVLVTAPLGARLVAPDVCAGVSEPGQLAELGHMARRFLGLVRARNPRELVEGIARNATRRV